MFGSLKSGFCNIREAVEKFVLSISLTQPSPQQWLCVDTLSDHSSTRSTNPAA